MAYSYLVEVDLDAADVCRAHWYHPKETVFPPPKERHTFVQHEEIFQPFCHVRRNRVKFACHGSKSSQQESYYGKCEANIPTKCRLFSTTQAVGLWKR